MIKDISFIKGVTMSELVITESTFNLIKSAGEPSTSGSFNFIYIILIFLMIMITLSILSYYKKLQREKDRQESRQSKLDKKSTAQTITSTDSTPNQVVSSATNVSEISDIEEQSFYSTENITAIDINSLDAADTSVQELIYALENN